MAIQPVASIPYIPALVVLVYYMIQRKSFSVITENVLKCIVGYYLVCIGASITIDALSPINDLLVTNYGIHGGILNTESFASILFRSVGNDAILSFLIAFGVNILLARFTGKPYLFLTCHHLLFLSMFSACVISANTSLKSIPCAVIGGILTGIYAFLITFFSSFAMKSVNPEVPSALAHSGNSAGMIALFVGRCFSRRRADSYGKEGKSQMSIFSVSTITVLIVYLLLCAAGHCLRAERVYDGLTDAFLYGASISILMLGFRMLLAPMITMLWDIAGKCVPKMVAGVDATALISYSPRAWNAGFLTASLGGTAVCLILFFFRARYVPFPGITSFYFAGGIGGVIGNASGGKTGARISGLVIGAVMMLLCFLLMTFSGVQMYRGIAPGETEYSILGLLIKIGCLPFSN